MQHSTKGFLIALAYGMTSASMAFANKAVLNSYDYDYPIFLVATQMLFTVVLLESLNMFNVVTLIPFTFERGKSFFLPSFFYAVNSVLGLTALSGMNIPMYGMVKRMGPLVTLILGTLLLGKGRPSSLVALSVGMITIGTVIASFGDLAFDLEAYIFGLASVFSQSIYQVLVQKCSSTLSASETLHLNSYNTLPLLFTFSFITGEMNSAVCNFHYLNIGFIVTFTLVISTGCVLNYLLFLCITYNSALTTSITGTLKSIVQTFIGMFTFGGISINIFTMSGIFVNIVGGALYSFIKYMQNKERDMIKSKSTLFLTPKTMNKENLNHGSVPSHNGKDAFNGSVSVHWKLPMGQNTRNVTHRISCSEDENQ